MLTVPPGSQFPSTAPSSPAEPTTPTLPPIAPMPHITVLSDLKWSPSSWLWPHRIPRGSITLLDGPSGSGKTQFLAELAARVSSGQPMPDGAQGRQGSVIFISSHDPYLYHLYPSFTRAHADTSRIFSFDITPDATPMFWNTPVRDPSNPFEPRDTFHFFRFDEKDLDALGALVSRTHCRLLIIDSWSTTLDESSSISERTIARLLHKLRVLVSVHNIACILVRSGDPRSRTNRLAPADKSPHLLASAPTTFSILPDPLAPDHSLLVPGKHTFSAATPILQFHITPDPEHPNFPLFHWHGPSDLSIEDLPIQPAISTLAPTREHILRILQQQPSSDPMPIPALLELLPHLGYQLLRKTLQRMLHDHQLVSPQRGLYALPSSQSPTPADTSPTPVPDPMSPSPSVLDSVSPEPVPIPMSPTSTLDTVSPEPVPDTVSLSPVPETVSLQSTSDTVSPSPVPDSVSPSPVPNTMTMSRPSSPDSTSPVPDSLSSPNVPIPISPQPTNRIARAKIL